MASLVQFDMIEHGAREKKRKKEKSLVDLRKLMERRAEPTGARGGKEERGH